MPKPILPHCPVPQALPGFDFSPLDTPDFLFDALAAVYPRRKDLSRARAIWRRLHPTRAFLDHCLAAIALQQSSIEWRNGFAPYLSTWLRQRRYQDRPDARDPALTATAAEAAQISRHLRAIGRCPHGRGCATAAECRQRCLRTIRGLPA